MLATWVPDVLRAAGIAVVAYPGWETRSHGEYRTPLSVTWHHDASAVGDSPSVPQSMIRRWDVAAAPAWVDRAGVWHIIAAGVAWHAGRVLPGKPGNYDSYGVETDHTTGEDWPPALLDSLRRGTAAILRHVGRSADPALEFHKTVCSPPGRKVDPDGLDLATERINVAAYMSGQPLPPGAPVRPAPAAGPAPSSEEYAMDTLDLSNAHRRLVTGRHVDNLQGLLLAAGYGPDGLVDRSGRPDGKAGGATRAALGAWQKRTNTGDGRGNPDYICGKNSWRTLIEH